MPAELMIRPSHNDHRFIGDLLAPGHAGRSPGSAPVVSRLVLDATLAGRADYAEDATAAGLPITIDPLTWACQSPTDWPAWAALPYARLPVTPEQLTNPARRRAFVRAVVDYELEHGATVVVPPYFNAAGPDDPWFGASRACVRETGGYLRDNDIRLPLMPVLAGRLDRFGRQAARPSLEEFSALSQELGAQIVVAQLGPVGDATDTYSKVLRLFQATAALRRPGLGVHVWRQGIYGPALVAAGAHGYETGVGYGEKTNLAGMLNRRKPRPNDGAERDRSGPGGRPVYVRALGRSISPRLLARLVADARLQPSVVCQAGCCPDGLKDTLGNARAHTVLVRAHHLAELAAMPPRASWRLHKIAEEARRAADLITAANPILVAASEKPLSAGGQQALADVAQFLQATANAAA